MKPFRPSHRHSGNRQSIVLFDNGINVRISASKINWQLPADLIRNSPSNIWSGVHRHSPDRCNVSRSGDNSVPRAAVSYTAIACVPNECVIRLAGYPVGVGRGARESVDKILRIYVFCRENGVRRPLGFVRNGNAVIRNVRVYRGVRPLLTVARDF